MLAILRNNFANILFFNVIWFSSVIGGLEWLWISVPTLVIYLLANFPTPKIFLSRVALPAGIGIAIDALLIQFEVFVFPEAATWMPVWLIVLWIGFATTLTKSLAIFARHWGFAIAAGMFGFPFSYLAAYRLGAVDFIFNPLLVALLLSGIWAFMLPALFWISKKEDKPYLVH